jgi:hypothetical protein
VSVGAFDFNSAKIVLSETGFAISSFKKRALR